LRPVVTTFLLNMDMFVRLQRIDFVGWELDSKQSPKKNQQQASSVNPRDDASMQWI
jgi:hypothetical protein